MSADTIAIVDTVNRYAVALDSRRYDLFGEVFTQDARCDFGGGTAFAGLDTIIATFDAIHAVFAATQHMTSGHVVHVTGESASCFSYVDARFRRDVDGKDALFASTGWYDDALVRTADGWRIRERASRMVSWTGEHRVMQAMPDVETTFTLVSLADEAAGGRIAFPGVR